MKEIGRGGGGGGGDKEGEKRESHETLIQAMPERRV